MEEALSQGSSKDSALPQAEHRRAVRVLYAFLGVELSYMVAFSVVYLVVLREPTLGILHVILAILALSLFFYLRLTKRTVLVAFGSGAIAAGIVAVLCLTGSAANSGTYSVFGGSIFLFFMLRRKYYLIIISMLGTIFTGALVLYALHVITLPYTLDNYALFVLSFFADNGLLVLYGREKAKVDQQLNTTLKQVRVLAKQLENEKESVEEKVRTRTAELRKEHAKLAVSIRSLEQGFILVAKDGRIELLNDIAAEVFGTNAEQATDQPLEAVTVHTKLNIDLAQAVESVLRSKQLRLLDAATDDGRFFTIFVTPVLSGAQELGVAILMEDVTEAKILDRSKDEFFSIASHELRTPLTAIRGNMSMAKEYFAKQLQGSALKDLVDDTHSASIRLIEIVNDFLDSSKLEQRKMVFAFEPVSIAPLLRAICEDLLVLTEAQHNTVHIAASIDHVPHVRADTGRLRQILYNVISNANKYSQSATITISAVHEERRVRIRITDTGKGISPENQKLLFHKFQQAGESTLTRDNTKGTGLGLYISKLLATNMHGDVVLEHSEEGKGSTFAVILPVARTSDAHHTKSS